LLDALSNSGEHNWIEPRVKPGGICGAAEPLADPRSDRICRQAAWSANEQ